MTLDQYVATHRAGKKIPAEIMERWNTRIVPRGLHRMGEAGAQHYLRDYGRGIATPKLIHLARCAEAQGYPDVARGFWRRAYELDPAAGDDAPQNLDTETPAPAQVKAALTRRAQSPRRRLPSPLATRAWSSPFCRPTCAPVRS